MGMGPRWSAGDPTPPNPNPSICRIVSREVIGDYEIMQVHYPQCTTFGGMKIIVAKYPNGFADNCCDPHFFEYGMIVARFPPTKEGWCMARVLLEETK